MFSFVKIASFLLLLASLSQDIHALQEQPSGGQSAQEKKLLQVARQSALIAGGARYCKLDTDDIEEFIGKTDARIVLLARDDYQKILGRLEFKNILAAASAKAPDMGCDKLGQQLAEMLRSSR